MDNDNINLPPNQDQKKYQQEDERGKWGERGFEQGGGQGSSESNYKSRDDEQKKGYDEDQPGHPVRSTGSTREDQESGASQPGDEKGETNY